MINWTIEEIQFLKEHYREGIGSCAKNLNKSYGAVYTKLQRLGIKPRRGKVKVTLSKKEIELFTVVAKQEGLNTSDWLTKICEQNRNTGGILVRTRRKRDISIYLTLDKDQEKGFREAARKCGLPLSTWMREQGIRNAENSQGKITQISGLPRK